MEWMSLNDSWSSTHRLFSRLLLKSLIMSERKSLRTSISSVLGAEFFNEVATTLSITDITCTQTQIYTHIVNFTREQSILERTQLNVTHIRLTWVLNLDSGVGLRMRLVNYLCAHLLCQNLVREARKNHISHIPCTEPNGAVMLGHLRGKCFVTSYRVL